MILKITSNFLTKSIEIKELVQAIWWTQK